MKFAGLKMPPHVGFTMPAKVDLDKMLDQILCVLGT